MQQTEQVEIWRNRYFQRTNAESCENSSKAQESTKGPPAEAVRVGHVGQQPDSRSALLTAGRLAL